MPRIQTGYLIPLQKVRERKDAAPEESKTLQELVINELKTKKHVASEGLVWLVRYVASALLFRIGGCPQTCLHSGV